MKTIYIHGSDDGIKWGEDGGSASLKNDSSSWGEGVEFRQHPSSEKDVYVASSGSDVHFSLDKTDADSSLGSGPVEMKPSSDQSVVLQEDTSAAQATKRGKRWYSGYVQS
ncbi:MAG: hypothetical protein AAF799_38640 [Myxococcota bacterium]